MDSSAVKEQTANPYLLGPAIWPLDAPPVPVHVHDPRSALVSLRNANVTHTLDDVSPRATPKQWMGSASNPASGSGLNPNPSPLIQNVHQQTLRFGVNDGSRYQQGLAPVSLGARKYLSPFSFVPSQGPALHPFHREHGVPNIPTHVPSSKVHFPAPRPPTWTPLANSSTASRHTPTIPETSFAIASLPTPGTHTIAALNGNVNQRKTSDSDEEKSNVPGAKALPKHLKFNKYPKLQSQNITPTPSSPGALTPAMNSSSPDTSLLLYPPSHIFSGIASSSTISITDESAPDFLIPSTPVNETTTSGTSLSSKISSMNIDKGKRKGKANTPSANNSPSKRRKTSDKDEGQVSFPPAVVSHGPDGLKQEPRDEGTRDILSSVSPKRARKAGAALVKRARRLKRSTGHDLTTGFPTLDDDDLSSWRAVNPPPFKSEQHHVIASVCGASCQPRVWASSRSELVTLLPQLSKSINGVSWSPPDTPVLILEGSGKWEGEFWNGGLEMSLEMVREPPLRTVELELEAPLAALNLSTPVRDPRKHHQLPMPPPDGCSSPYPIPSCPPLRASCFCNGFNYRHGPICSVESINPPLPPSFAKGFPDAEQALPSNPIVPNPQDVTKPSDIDILERAMTTKTPVLIIISRSSPLLPFNLSNDCAYSFLGYWIIHEMDSERVGVLPMNTAGVMWRLKLNWVSGGEAFLEDEERVSKPWWMPTATDSDRAFPDLRPYPKSSREFHYSFLPLELLAPSNSNHMGRGWYCRTCGKLNEHLLLRMKRCESPFCKALKSDSESKGKGYAPPIVSIRDPSQTLQLFMPSNRYPSAEVNCSDERWEDGMSTYKYFDRLQGGGSGWVISHAFTSNKPELQEEAGELLVTIQEDVELRRASGANPGPYFKYQIAGEDHWENVPESLLQARDLMEHNARTYAECSDVSISELTVIGWTTTGSKRGHHVDSRTKPTTFLCLGSDIVLSLVPKSGRREPPKAELPGQDVCDNPQDLDGLIALDDDEEDKNLKGGLIVGPLASENGHGPSDRMNISAKPLASISPTPAAAAPKKSVKKLQEVLLITVTLVHGDILVLSGDEYEYSKKRTGMSILLVGT